MKIVYCHNPARWLYQPHDYARDARLTGLAIRALRQKLMRHDRRGQREAAAYIANSQSVASRILSVYGRRASVIHPPRGLEPDGPESPIPGIQPGFFMTVGRPRGYKNVATVHNAIALRPKELLVSVGGVRTDIPNVITLRNVTDPQLRWLYKNCYALLGVSYEDFGLTPPEAMSHGKPVGLLRAGGYLETNVEGLTGVFIDQNDTHSVCKAIDQLLATQWDAAAILRHADQWSPRSFRKQIIGAVEDIVATSG